MTPEQETKILASAINTFGINAQLDILMEECAELIQAICKYKRGAPTPAGTLILWGRMHEEMADVEIMIDQARVYTGDADINVHREHKLKRLEERIAQRRAGKDG